MISFSRVELECKQGDKLQVLNEQRNYLLYDQCHQFQKKASNKTVVNFALARAAKHILVRLQTTSNRTLTATFDVVFIDTTPDVQPLRAQSASSAAVIAPQTARPLSTTKITKALSHCKPFASFLF